MEQRERKCSTNETCVDSLALARGVVDVGESFDGEFVLRDVNHGDARHFADSPLQILIARSHHVALMHLHAGHEAIVVGIQMHSTTHTQSHRIQ